MENRIRKMSDQVSEISDEEFSAILDQYSETKHALERMANRRESIRDNALKMLRVYLAGIAAIVTALGLAGVDTISNRILISPICAITYNGICLRTGQLLTLIGLIAFLSGIFFVLSISGSRISSRSIGADVRQILNDEFDGDQDYIEDRLEQYLWRFELEFRSTRTMDLGLSAGIFSGMLSGILFLIIIFNAFTGNPIDGLGLVPFGIISLVLGGILVLTIIGWIKMLVSKRKLLELDPEDLMDGDRELPA